MISGKLLRYKIPRGALPTRKLMLSDLNVTESLASQELGIGDKQFLGLGIFMPHKGIDAVNKKQEE